MNAIVTTIDLDLAEQVLRTARKLQQKRARLAQDAEIGFPVKIHGNADERVFRKLLADYIRAFRNTPIC